MVDIMGIHARLILRVAHWWKGRCFIHFSTVKFWGKVTGQWVWLQYDTAGEIKFKHRLRLNVPTESTSGLNPQLGSQLYSNRFTVFHCKYFFVCGSTVEPQEYCSYFPAAVQYVPEVHLHTLHSSCWSIYYSSFCFDSYILLLNLPTVYTSSSTITMVYIVWCLFDIYLFEGWEDFDEE